MPSIIVKCPNLGNDADNPCEHEFELERDVEPADPSYGADADGNRGMHIPAYIIPPDPPVACSHCHAIFDKTQTDDLIEQIRVACDDWKPSDEYDPPEYEREDDLYVSG